MTEDARWGFTMTIEQRVQVTLGRLIWENLVLTHQLEDMQAKVDQLLALHATQKVPDAP